MLYTPAEAAEATGLERSIILRALEDGQISGTQDLSGEWHVEDVEIYRLYLFVAQHYCRRMCRADATTPVAEMPDAVASVQRQPIDDLRESRCKADQAAETPPSMPTTAPTGDYEIRIGDRDKISISTSFYGVHQTRITRMAFVALGYVGALSLYYFFFGQSLVSQQKVNPSMHFSSEGEALSSPPTEG